MGFFNSSKTPNTISDKQMASLQKRAQKAAPSMFSDKAIKHRKAQEAQRRKASQS